MHLYFDNGVLKPLRTIGLGKSTNVDDYFTDVKDLKESADVKTSLEDASAFCESTGKPAFAKMSTSDKNSLDLTPLCKFPGSTEKISSDVEKIVAARANKMAG